MFNRKRVYTIVIDKNDDMVDEVECVLDDLGLVTHNGVMEAHNTLDVTILAFESRVSRKRLVKRLIKGLAYCYDLTIGTHLIIVSNRRKES